MDCSSQDQQNLCDDDAAAAQCKRKTIEVTSTSQKQKQEEVAPSKKLKVEVEKEEDLDLTLPASYREEFLENNRIMYAGYQLSKTYCKVTTFYNVPSPVEPRPLPPPPPASDSVTDEDDSDTDEELESGNWRIFGPRMSPNVTNSEKRTKFV